MKLTGIRRANAPPERFLILLIAGRYEYNAFGQQVVRRLTQAGQTIHSVHDADGNRIAEYDYDEVSQSSTLLREQLSALLRGAHVIWLC